MRPYPKKKRIVNQKEIDYVHHKRDGACIAGLELKQQCIGALHVHHIDTKGSGGDDVRENLITLCTLHHEDVHWGRIKKEKLYEWLEKRYGTQRKS